MAKKTYIVVTPLKVGAGEDKSEIVEPGKPVTLEEKEAKPLLECGALREPDVVETDKKK